MWHTIGMPKRINYALTEAELETIEDAIQRDERPAERRRATAVRMLHLGKKPGEVAELLLVSEATIYNWHARWRNGGIEALANQPKSGRPLSATEAYRERLHEVMEQEPSASGYAFTVWTTARLQEHMAQETGIEMCNETLRQVLSDEGYVYRRPKHDLTPLQDAQARARAEEVLEMLKKRPKQEKSNSSLWTKSP